MQKRRSVGIASRTVLAISALVIGFASHGAEADNAESSAEKILRLLGESNYGELWGCCVSTDVKAILTRDAFIAQMSIGRAPFGSPADPPKMISSTFATVAPSVSGAGTKSGRFYSFTYATSYQTAKYYEAISVVLEPDGIFRMWGINGAARKD